MDVADSTVQLNTPDGKMEAYEASNGFFCDERPSYHEESAKDAWEKIKSVFAQHLK
jgi:carboxymethylenebutenolidase